LAPAGHAAVDEARVSLQTDVRAEAHALGHAGAEALEERVGLFDELEHGRHALGILQVDGDRAAAAEERAGVLLARVLDAVDADHLGAQVGEEHRAEGAGADAGELEDFDSFERAHGDLQGVRLSEEGGASQDRSCCRERERLYLP
jgi:hypothetical protein